MLTPRPRTLLRSLFRILAGAGLGLGVIYLVLAGLLYVGQRSILFHPQTRDDVPQGIDPASILAVTLHTADGETLRAFYMAPRPGRPTIIFFDGNGGNGAYQEGRWRRVAAQGVGLFTFVYRGYPGSTGHASEAGLQEDGRAAYAWVAARTSPDQIVLHGLSLGSGVAVRVAAEHPARALILEAPYTSIREVAGERFMIFPADLLVRDRFESRRWIRRVHIPVLIVHGDRDTVIPHHFGRSLYELANPPKRFVAIAGGDHNTLVRDGFYDQAWSFLGLESGPGPTSGKQADHRQAAGRR